MAVLTLAQQSVALCEIAPLRGNMKDEVVITAMLKKGTSRLCAALVAVSFSLSAQADYSAEAKDLIDEMVAEHQFERAELVALFKATEKQQKILDAMDRPAEKTKKWKDYRKIFLTDSRINAGVKFWQDNREALVRAEQEYQVPAEIIVAIIGVETFYGRLDGGYRVIDALSTLAFDYPRRSAYFTKELKAFLLLAREQKQDPLKLKGSYAGAMGYGQFMPSSFHKFAVDFDGDGTADIWKNPTDAIGSVANYFHKSGWAMGEEVVTRARIRSVYDRDLVNQGLKPHISVGELDKKGFEPLATLAADTQVLPMRLEGEYGAEFWLGLHNFYVITRYNRSRMYSLAVHQLSQELKAEVAKS